MEMSKEIRNWSFQEGEALISAYKNRKEEYNKCRNKNYFWENILVDLESMNVLNSETTVHQVKSKWKTLYRAYKNARDRGSGLPPSKFLYMEQMDELFHDNPLITCNHVVSVGAERNPTPASMLKEIGNKNQSANSKEEESNTCPPTSTEAKKRKRKPTESFVEMKKRFYEEVLNEKREKRFMLQKYLEEKEINKDRRHKEILELFSNKS